LGIIPFGYNTLWGYSVFILFFTKKSIAKSYALNNKGSHHLIARAAMRVPGIPVGTAPAAFFASVVE